MATLRQNAWLGRSRQRDLGTKLIDSLGQEIRANDPVLGPLYGIMLQQYQILEVTLTAIYDEAGRREEADFRDEPKS